MSDRALRDAERATHAGEDLEALARLAAEHVRRLGRDPRIDPRRRDEVARAKASTAFGARQPLVSRWVYELWPRPLLRQVLYEPTWGQRPVDDDPWWLPVGTLILSPPKVWRTTFCEGSGTREPSAWSLAVRSARSGAVREVIVEEWPEIEAGDPEPHEVEAVSWDWHRGGPRGNYRTQTSSIDQWRRWARGGTVLRVGDA